MAEWPARYLFSSYMATMSAHLVGVAAVAPESYGAETGAGNGTEANGTKARIGSANPTGGNGHMRRATSTDRTYNVGSVRSGSSSKCSMVTLSLLTSVQQDEETAQMPETLMAALTGCCKDGDDLVIHSHVTHSHL